MRSLQKIKLFFFKKKGQILLYIDLYILLKLESHEKIIALGMLVVLCGAAYSNAQETSKN
jgi:hypothetical protein